MYDFFSTPVFISFPSISNHEAVKPVDKGTDIISKELFS
jgi:hypothetical protein